MLTRNVDLGLEQLCQAKYTVDFKILKVFCLALLNSIGVTLVRL